VQSPDLFVHLQVAKRFHYGENMAHRLTRLQVIFLTIIFFIVSGVCKKIYNRWSSARNTQIEEQQEAPAEVQENVDTDRLKKLEQQAKQQIAVSGEKIQRKKKDGFDVSPALVMLKNAKNAYDLSDFENAVEYARQASNIADSLKMTSAEYVVKKGDTLWNISEEKYRKGSKWYDIWKVNKEKIPDFDKIYRGQVLTIPDVLQQNNS
jgi:nucleoid-associated protein YgaU